MELTFQESWSFTQLGNSIILQKSTSNLKFFELFKSFWQFQILKIVKEIVSEGEVDLIKCIRELY